MVVATLVVVELVIVLDFQMTLLHRTLCCHADPRIVYHFLHAPEIVQL